MSDAPPGPEAPDPVDVVAFGDGLLAHQRRHRTVHVLNASAAAVWEAARHGADPDAVVAELAAAYGRPAAELDGDVRSTLDELAAAGLVGDDAPADPSAPEPPTGAPPTTAADPGAPTDPTSLVARLLHVDVAVAGPAEAIEAVAPLLAALPTPTGPPALRYRLRPGADDRWWLDVDGEPAHGPAALDAVLRHLLWHANHTAIAREATWLLLHAGAAVGPAGAVAVAGEPDAGKSTLTAALCRRGLAYGTDEAVALDRAAAVAPYPKALTLDRSSLRLLGIPDDEARAGHLAPHALGPVATGSAPLVAVVLPDRRVGADAHLTRLPPAEAALALAGVTFNLPATGRPGLALLAHLAEHVPVHRLVLDALDPAVDVVAALAGG